MLLPPLRRSVVQMQPLPLQALLPGGRGEQREAGGIPDPPHLVVVIELDVGRPLDMQQAQPVQVDSLGVEATTRTGGVEREGGYRAILLTLRRDLAHRPTRCLALV